MTRESELRQQIVAQCRAMNALGLNQGAAGNISVRHGAKLLITPTSVPYDRLAPEMIAQMPLAGDDGAWEGPLPPSSEWRFHLDIMRSRQDVSAIVHAHPVHATALAVLNKPLPAVHYMIAAFGGPLIRCAGYAPFGTQELSELALKGLEGMKGVLLANHGTITCGKSLDEAMWLTGELETLARLYLTALQAGDPVILPDEEVARIAARFKAQGYSPAHPPGSAIPG